MNMTYRMAMHYQNGCAMYIQHKVKHRSIFQIMLYTPNQAKIVHMTVVACTQLRPGLMIIFQVVSIQFFQEFDYEPIRPLWDGSQSLPAGHHWEAQQVMLEWQSVVKLSAHTSRRPCWIWEVWGRHAWVQPYQNIYQFVGHALGPVNMTEILLLMSAHEHDNQYTQLKVVPKNTIRCKEHQ